MGQHVQDLANPEEQVVIIIKVFLFSILHLIMQRC